MTAIRKSIELVGQNNAETLAMTKTCIKVTIKYKTSVYTEQNFLWQQIWCSATSDMDYNAEAIKHDSYLPIRLDSAVFEYTLRVIVMMQLVQQHVPGSISNGHETSTRTKVQAARVLQCPIRWRPV